MSRTADTMWSRRRAAVQAEAESERLADEKAVIAKVQAGQEHKSDADILQELSLKDPDEMQAGDDFAAFMRDEVPQRLRKRALRILWRSNPVLACVDDLLDYGDDFKAEWNATGVIKTTYQVGKGMLAHTQEMERQKLAAEAAANAPEVAELKNDETPGIDDGAGQANAPELAEPLFQDGPDAILARETVLAGEQDEETPTVIVAHRMRFEFDGAT